MIVLRKYDVVLGRNATTYHSAHTITSENISQLTQHTAHRTQHAASIPRHAQHTSHHTSHSHHVCSHSLACPDGHHLSREHNEHMRHTLRRNKGLLDRHSPKLLAQARLVTQNATTSEVFANATQRSPVLAEVVATAVQQRQQALASRAKPRLEVRRGAHRQSVRTRHKPAGAVRVEEMLHSKEGRSVQLVRVARYWSASTCPSRFPHSLDSMLAIRRDVWLTFGRSSSRLKYDVWLGQRPLTLHAR